MDVIELNKWFKFIGYGDPNSRLWFVGIEEGGLQVTSLMPNQQVYSFEDNELLYDENIPEGSNRVWDVSKRIAVAALEPKYFMSNIAPLPRKYENEKLAVIENVKEYRKRVIDERIARLKLLHRYCNERVTIFHGAGTRKRYNLLNEFGLNTCSGKYISRNILAFKDERLIFTNSFSRGYAFPNSHIEIVSDLINDWFIG